MTVFVIHRTSLLPSPQLAEEGFLDTSQQSVLSLDCDYSTPSAASPHPHVISQYGCIPLALPAVAVPPCYSSLPVGHLLCGVFDFNMRETYFYVTILYVLALYSYPLLPPPRQKGEPEIAQWSQTPCPFWCGGPRDGALCK